MALRSRYRDREKPQPPNIQGLADYLKPQPAETPAPSDEKIQPSETVHIDFATDEKPSEAVAEAIEKAGAADEAAEALRYQLNHLRASEQLQREHAAQMIAARAQPPTREQKLEMWRRRGLTEEDGRFLSENPEMIDRDDLTHAASAQAEQQGHERDSDAHRAATLEAFRRLQGQQAQAQPAAADPAGFFEPPEPSRSPAAQDRASMYSAPVSRRDAGTPRELSPRSVKLSPIEQEIARNLGLSDTAYAHGKLRLAREKATGERQQ
jgi:hypothetical protein